MSKLTLIAEKKKEALVGTVLARISSNQYMVSAGGIQYVVTSHVQGDIADNTLVNIIFTEQGKYIISKKDFASRSEQIFVFNG